MAETKFWTLPSFNDWAANEIKKSATGGERRFSEGSLDSRYNPPSPSSSNAQSTSNRFSEAMFSPYASPEVMKDWGAITGRAPKRPPAPTPTPEPPFPTAPFSPGDPNLLAQFRKTSLSQDELSYEELMGAKSERESDLYDRRIVPYDFGLGDMWKLEQDLWASYATSARLASKGEINPFQAAGRMLTSTFDFWKNMFVSQDQEERVWITRDDPETGQSVILPADIRERPPAGKLVSSLWQVPKGWLGRARQENPAVDVLAHGINGIISLARLGVDLGPFGYARASVLGKDDANKGRFTALPEDWNFWDRFRTSWTWWGELVKEDLAGVPEAWGAGIDMMEGHFERNPLFPVRGETFAIQPEWERNLFGLKTVTQPPINMDLIPEHLRKPYDEMTRRERAELLDLQFEAQSVVSSYQYRYWFEKIKEQNPNMPIEQVRLSAAEIAWSETKDQPIPSEVADGFGDLMGAFYYYFLNSGNPYDLANQTDLAAIAFTEITPADAQEALQLAVQGAQKIGDVIFSVDPDHAYTFMMDEEAEKAYLEQRDLVTEQLGRDLGYWESFRLKEHHEDPTTEMIGELLLDFGNIRPFTYMWEALFGGAWRTLKASAGGTLEVAKKVPVLGNAIRWLTKETAISLGRRIGFHASEVFGVFFQSAKDTDSFIKMIDDFGRFNRIPITARARQLRLADELSKLARIEEWPRMADRAVESAIKKARDLAKARGVVDPEVLAQITPEPRLVVEELAGRFEALHMDKVKAATGTRLVSEAKSSFDHFFSVLRRTWIEQVLSARPGFTVINYLDSGFRMVLYGATVHGDLETIMARTDIPREVYLRFPVTEAGAELPLGKAPELGPLTYFLDNTGTSTISDWPWPIGKKPWVRTKEAAEAFAIKHPTLNRIAETLNWGNWGAAWKQYNAWFEFAMSVRLYDSMYWRTFMPLDNAIGERLILQMLGSNSDDAQRIARSIWKEAKDNPARLQELAAESMFGKGAGEGRPMWSWLIPPQLDDWLRGMPPEVQTSFVEGVVDSIRPLLREGNWTPESLRAAFDSYMDDYVREWTMHQAARGADDVMRGRGGVADDASRRAGQTTIDDVSGSIDDITGDTRASEPLKPKGKEVHPVVDELIELGAVEQGYTGPIAMARALEGGADPSRDAIKRVGDMITEGVVVRAEDGTYGLSDELIEEYTKRAKPEGVQVPLDAEQRAAQAGIITPEQQAAGDALAEEVETTAKTLQDAIEEVRSEKMTQQDLDAINRGGEEAKAVIDKRELMESEARNKAEILTARATDEQLLEAMNFENKERILAGERPQPLMGNGAQDYASQEWLRRNPPIDPEDALPAPSTPIGERPDALTLEGREEILRRMDDDWDNIALAKGDDAVAAREAGLRSRKAMAKAGDAIAKGGDLPPHLAVFWDDIDVMRGRAQDFFRYEIMGADSIKEYFTKTGPKWGFYWQVQEQIYNASAKMADDLVEVIATGEARFVKRKSVKEFMELIGFPLDLDETGRLVAIIDQNNVFRNTPIKLQESLNNFESLMYKNAPHKYPWDAPFPGRPFPPSGTEVPVWKPTDPKVGPGGGAVPPPSVGPQGPTADVKPLDDAGRGWTMGEVGIDDIKLTPEFQPRDTAGNELQVDPDRVRVMGQNWDWKKYEAIKVNVVQPGEASLYGKGIEDGDIVLMGGHHRYAAGIEAGVDDFPSQLYQVQFDEAKKIATLDNMIRQDQTPYEKGRIFKSRMESGATETELATVIFNDPNKASYVAKLVSLTELSPDVARMVGHYSWFNEKHGFALADAVRQFDINPEFQQQIVTKYLAEYAPSVEQFRQFLAHYGPRNKRAVQMGLFAMDESWLSAFASTQDEIKLLEGRARKVKGVINDPELAESMGINVDEAQKIIDDLRAKKAELTEMSGIDPGTPRTPQQVEKAEKIAGVEKKIEAFIDEVDAKAGVVEAPPDDAQVLGKIEVEKRAVSKSRIQELLDEGKSIDEAREIAKAESVADEVEELVEEGFTDPLLEDLRNAGREPVWYWYKDGDATLDDVQKIIDVQARYTAKTYGVDPLVVIDDLKAGKETWEHYPYHGETSDLYSDILKWGNKESSDLREAIKQEAKRAGTKGSPELTRLEIQLWTEWENAHSVAKSVAYLENIIPLEVRLAWAREKIARKAVAEARRLGHTTEIDFLEGASKKAGLDFHSTAKEWGIEPQKVRDLLAGQDPVDILKVAYDEAEEVADAAIKQSRKIETAAEEAKAAVEPSTGDIGTSADAGSSVDLSERVGTAGPDTVVRREAERLVPSESRITHAGGGDAAGTKSKEGIITVAEENLPQPMEFVSGENLDDVYTRTLDYYLGKGLSQAEAEAKAFNFLEHQVDNANRAFTSFDTQRGFVIADGTGTGKTYSGALIIDQVFERGGNRVMLIAPNELILRQWRDVLEPLGIAMERFGTKNGMPKLLLPPRLTLGPRGTVYATTYHSMNSWAKNKTLIEMVGDDLLDLVIFDESHYLKNFYTGDTARAIAGVDLSKLSNHALFMSATPMESPLHAGYLLESTGVFDDFDNMLEFLGITRRTEEITRYRGGQKIKTLVETFDGVTPQKLATLNDQLVRDGRYIRHNLSFDGMFNKNTGEQLAMYSASVPVPIDPETAMMYQRFMEITENFATGRHASTIGGQRVGVGRSILENGKMNVALDLAQKKVDEGKSVAIFVWRKQGTRFEDHLAAFRAGEKTYAKGSIMPRYYEALTANGISTTSPIELALERFPDAVVISGDVTGKARLAAMEQFNTGKAKVVVATIDAGGTGLSLHDTIGDYARVQINLTVPYTALGVDQTAGRTFRMGSQSHGELYWLYTPIPLEEQYTKRTMKLMERMGALIEGDDAAKIVSDAEMTEFLFAIDDGTTKVVSNQMPSSSELQEIMTDVVGDLDDVRLTPPWEREGWEKTFAPGFIDPEDAVPTVKLPPEQKAIKPATQDYIEGAESYEDALETVSVHGSNEEIIRFETINGELDDLARADDELLSQGAASKERQAIWNRMNELAEEMQEMVVRIRTESVIPDRAFYVVADDATRPRFNRLTEDGKLNFRPKAVKGVSGLWIGKNEDTFEQIVKRADWTEATRKYEWVGSYRDSRGMIVTYGNEQYILTGERAIIRTRSSYAQNIRVWFREGAEIKAVDRFDFDYTRHINKKVSDPYHPQGLGDIHMPMDLPDRDGTWITVDLIEQMDGSKTYILEQAIPKEDFPAGEIITREKAFQDPVIGHRGVEFKFLDTEYVTSGNTLEVNVLPKSADEVADAPSVFDLPPEAREAGDPQPMVVATEAGPQITMFGESIVAGEDFLVDEVHIQAFRIEAGAREWIARFGDEAADHGTFLRALEKDRSRLEGAVGRGVFADEEAAKTAIKEVQDLINEVNAVASQIKYSFGTQDTLFSVGFIPFFMRPKGVRVQAEAAVDGVSHLHAAGNAVDNWYRWLIDGGADDMFKAVPEDDMANLTEWANAAINAKKEIRDVARYGSADAGELLFVDEVIDGALPETLRVMIDYATEFNIDSIFKHFFPFWKFPTRSIPFWIEAVATHPEILTFWMKYQYMSERYIYQAGAVDSQGRPLNRFKGYIPLPGSNNLWWNPLAPLSAKVVLPGDRIIYSDEDQFGSDMSPLEQTVNIAYRWARQMGFNLAPWWEFFIRQSSMIDRDQYPTRTIIPVIDMIPPWVQYDVIQNLRKLHLWPSTDVNYLSPQVTWKDYLVERELLGMQYQAMLVAPDMEKAEIAMAAEQAILEREGNPIWDAAQRKVEESEYYHRVFGFFTGIYAKEYTDGEAELRRLRHEINFLYDMINDEVGASIFGLPGEEQARREAHQERRYSVDDGVIYGLYSTIGWQQTPTEGSLSGDRRRAAVAEDVATQIQRRDYFRYNELIYDTLQSQLMSLPVGAPYELKEKYYAEYGQAKSFAETTGQFSLARRTVHHPGPGSDETTWADWFADTWYGILNSTRPKWDKDSETYPEYEQRVAKWKQDLPMIAEQTLPHFQRDLTTLPPDAVWPDLLAISTGSYMDKWDLDNDSAVDALNRVWDDNYWSAYWDEVSHLDGYERDIAEMKFKMTWPMAPTEETLLNWVEQIYGSRFTREELREIINSGVMDIEGRQAVGKTEHDKMADQVWLWFGWVGPNKSALEKAYFAYGGDPRDWDKWWSSDGDPSAWKDPEVFEKFYGQVSAAAGSLNLQQPSMESLEEWAVVQDLHAAYKEEAKMRFGENIFVVSAQYSESPRSAQAEFRAAHPELEAFWDFRDEYALKHPLWGQYYNANAKASSGSGVAAGSSKSYSSSSASRVSKSAAATQTIPTLAYRSTYDIEELMERGPGRGRATRLVKWPVTLQRIVPDELEEEVEKAAETGGSISSAANDYLDYLKDAVPDEQTFLENLQRDLFAHREKPYGAGLG